MNEQIVKGGNNKQYTASSTYQIYEKFKTVSLDQRHSFQKRGVAFSFKISVKAIL